ncbi:(Fe-S)-binding protein [Helicobacter mustelae]|uniref:Glycolate oxidase iron-sulfur subunit n=1 Tax=Helicobacter mustelae (strain ATCC 43772 / CCUG 25715 / CIP 103759 / LMG 18044 / NCTC 12198 / R85-136P) TaxID=679897 RepID=D3UIC8_HELM1|nr:(Fe-S)-binding protein [Helicobacter mustelae]CBG40251.1 putative oxidoreductase ferredoxin-type electron transport protein [Helicobacter mustelae 12198]SQH71750.1 oxidoreductase ferredoxin-type electron transport protein [Helicobacter mustelae]
MQKIPSACVKCAKCIQACTTYQVHRDEVHSPRGFLELIEGVEISNKAGAALQSCFLCAHCVSACPLGLPVDFAIMQARSRQKKGVFERFYYFLLRHRFLMNVVFSVMACIPACAFKSKEIGVLFKLPFSHRSFLSRHKNLPRGQKSSTGTNSANVYSPANPLAPIKLIGPLDPRKMSFSPRNPSNLPASKEPLAPLNLTKPLEPEKLGNKGQKRRVAIFIGCLANYNYPSTGEALLKILDALKIEAILPRQECCAAPALFGGDMQTTLLLIKKNIEYFEDFIDDVEAILVPEATCAAVMCENWRQVLLLYEQKEWQDRWERIAPKIMLSTVFFEKHTELSSLLKSKPKKEALLTYHDPCHACHVLKSKEEPRRLLKQNFAMQELGDSQKCCGFGGVGIQLNNPKITRAVGKQKISHIVASGANVVSAECSACRIQIDALLKEEDLPIVFAHPLELIAQNL